MRISLLVFFYCHQYCLPPPYTVHHSWIVVIRLRLDGCIVWNEHNTVFGSKAICAQAVYLLHSRCVVSRACDWVRWALSAVFFKLAITTPRINLIGYGTVTTRVIYFQFRPAFLPCRSARRHSGVVGLPNVGHRTSSKISVGRFLVRSV